MATFKFAVPAMNVSCIVDLYGFCLKTLSHEFFYEIAQERKLYEHLEKNHNNLYEDLFSSEDQALINTNFLEWIDHYQENCSFDGKEDEILDALAPSFEYLYLGAKAVTLTWKKLKEKASSIEEAFNNKSLLVSCLNYYENWHDALSAMENYEGTYQSKSQYAEERFPLYEIPKHLRDYIDFVQYAKVLEQGGVTFLETNDGYHVIVRPPTPCTPR